MSFLDETTDGPVLYRHRPIEKQVFRYDGTNGMDIALWADSAYLTAEGDLIVRNVQGEFIARPGDYVVRGIENEIYPVPASIFEDSYEPVGEG